MKKRIITLAAVAVLAGLCVTVLVAAREAGDKAPESPGKPTNGGKKLVCIGYVDVKDRVVAIYPDNFPQSAKVTEVLVKEGDKVKAKQPLLKFDNEMLVLKVQEAEAAMKAANADQEKADAMIKAHQSQVNVLEKELQAEEAKLDAKEKLLEETRRAVNGGTRNKVELEEPEAAVKAAKLTLIAARLKWENAKAEEPTYLRRAAAASFRRAEVLKAQAEHARDQMVCKAPADGRIIRSFVSEGQLFGMQSREPAFWFLKEGPPIVRAEVPQEFANRVTEGQAAKIEDEADPKQVWRGKVAKVPDQFLPKRFGSTGMVDLMPVNDERVLECQVSIDLGPGETPPRYGQKVRVTLGE
jgi:multidrug resistance efflux pump